MRSLGKSLRAIADRFSEVVQGREGQAKEISLDALSKVVPNIVWSGIITYVFEKFINRYISKRSRSLPVI